MVVSSFVVASAPRPCHQRLGILQGTHGRTRREGSNTADSAPQPKDTREAVLRNHRPARAEAVPSCGTIIAPEASTRGNQPLHPSSEMIHPNTQRRFRNDYPQKRDTHAREGKPARPSNLRTPSGSGGYTPAAVKIKPDEHSNSPANSTPPPPVLLFTSAASRSRSRRSESTRHRR